MRRNFSTERNSLWVQQPIKGGRKSLQAGKTLGEVRQIQWFYFKLKLLVTFSSRYSFVNITVKEVIRSCQHPTRREPGSAHPWGACCPLLPPLPGSPPAAGSTKGETSPNLLSAPNFSKKQLKMSKTVFPGYVIDGGPEGLTRVEFYGFVRRKKRTQLPKPTKERHSKHWWPLLSVVSALMTWNHIHWWHCCRQQHRRMLLFAVAELILIVS